MNESVDGRLLVKMLAGFTVSKVVAVTARLGVADKLDSAKDIGALAGELACDERSLRRLVRVLAGLGLVTLDTDNTVTLTPLGAFLRTDHPRSALPLAKMIAEPALWDAWGALEHAVRTGDNATKHVTGMTVWEYFEENPQAGDVFNAGQAHVTADAIKHVVAEYDFTGFKSVVDVGGGTGTLVAAVLAANPDVHGVLFDTESTLRTAPQLLTAAGVADRCTLQAGDFLADVPPNADAYLLKSILHDWDDDSCVRILRNCRRAMNDNGKVLVLGTLVPEQVTPSAGLNAAVADLEMMIVCPGAERTLSEYSDLFAAAGLALGPVTTLRGKPDYHVIEALPR